MLETYYRDLTAFERQTVYSTRYANDFPLDERKPPDVLEQFLKMERYRCLGFFRGATLLAYAFVMPGASGWLLDYFAVDAQTRGTGIGTQALAGLRAQMPADLPLFVETEDPAAPCDDRAVRERRIRFYEKCGMTMTNIHVNLFGVAFRIMTLGDGTAAQLEQTYLWAMGEKLVRENIQISEQSE